MSHSVVKKWSVKNYKDFRTREGVIYECDLYMNGVKVGNVDLSHPGAAPMVRVNSVVRKIYEQDAKTVGNNDPFDVEEFIEVIFSQQNI